MTVIVRTAVEGITVAVLGTVCTFLAGMIVGSFIKPQYFDFLAIAPTFFLPIACGAIFAWYRRRRHSAASAFAWVFPAAVAACFFVGVIDSKGGSWAYAARNFFTADCGSTECLYEYLFLVPTAAAISYSVSAMIIARNLRASNES